MTTVDQASQLLRELAEPRPVGDTVKAAITRAARAVSAVLQEPMSYGRAEDIWRREARRIDAAEMDAIRAAHARRAGELRTEVQKAAALAQRLERLVAQASPASSGEDLEQLRSTADEAWKAARTLRRLASEARGA
ncbi:hypothetical protein [Methylobacterium nodulans]|nr:hypothetical protein [Methylobacterium nodulans]